MASKVRKDPYKTLRSIITPERKINVKHANFNLAINLGISKPNSYDKMLEVYRNDKLSKYNPEGPEDFVSIMNKWKTYFDISRLEFKFNKIVKKKEQDVYILFRGTTLYTPVVNKKLGNFYLNPRMAEATFFSKPLVETVGKKHDGIEIKQMKSKIKRRFDRHIYKFTTKKDMLLIRDTKLDEKVLTNSKETISGSWYLKDYQVPDLEDITDKKESLSDDRIILDVLQLDKKANQRDNTTSIDLLEINIVDLDDLKLVKKYGVNFNTIVSPYIEDGYRNIINRLRAGLKNNYDARNIALGPQLLISGEVVSKGLSLTGKPIKPLTLEQTRILNKKTLLALRSTTDQRLIAAAVSPKKPLKENKEPLRSRLASSQDQKLIAAAVRSPSSRGRRDLSPEVLEKFVLDKLESKSPKIDNRSPTTKMLDLALVPGLAGIINEYKKPGTFENLLEQWQYEKFKGTDFKLDANSRLSSIIEEFNFILWQYYFDVNNIIVRGGFFGGDNIYTIKAGTRLFLPSLELQDFKQLKEGYDARGINHHFFFTPRMAESSMVDKFIDSIEEKKKVYRDYYIIEYVVKNDLKVMFNETFTMDIKKQNELRNPETSFDGILITSQFLVPRMLRYENMNQLEAKTFLKKSADDKAADLRISDIRLHYPVTMPSLIILNPNNLILINPYTVNSKHLIDRYVNEMDKILVDRSNNEPSAYRANRAMLGPRIKPIDKDFVPPYLTDEIINEVDTVVESVLGIRGFSGYEGFDFIKYLLPREELIELLNKIKSVQLATYNEEE